MSDGPMVPLAETSITALMLRWLVVSVIDLAVSMPPWMVLWTRALSSGRRPQVVVRKMTLGCRCLNMRLRIDGLL